MQEFQWLHENAYIVRLEYSNVDKIESTKWLNRYDAFKDRIFQLNCLYRFIIESPNKVKLLNFFKYFTKKKFLEFSTRNLSIFMGGSRNIISS